MSGIAMEVRFTDADMIVELLDGNTITIPIAHFLRLSHASRVTLNHWELLGEGEGIHWPDIDEDLNVEELLLGID